MPRDLRVAMVIQSFLPVLGGAQRQVDLLGPLLERRGVAVTVITRRPKGSPARERRPGLDVRRMPGPPTGALGSLAYTTAGAGALVRVRPDVVHVHDLLSPATIALLARPAIRAPIVAKVLSTGTGGDVDRLLTKPLGRRRLAALARRVSAFVCLSADVERELTAQGVPATALHRIPNGVDAERFHPPEGHERATARRAIGVDGDEPIALYCGRFDPVKRLDLLVTAIAAVPGTRLVLAGEGSETERLRAVAAEVGASERVTLLATVDDPALLYRAADVYVSASSTEGMSNSVLEAMASGVPIVALRASGMEELVGAGGGALVDDASPEALASAVAAVLSNSERRAQLGAAARGRAQAEFSLAATADRLTQLYRDVSERR